MPPMPILPRIADLYPPATDPNQWRQLASVATTDRDAAGNFVLRRSLTEDERKKWMNRADVLAPWLRSGSAGKIAEAVNQMMTGFASKSSEEDEAAASVTQYVSALRDVPLWAIQRACMMFTNNQVRDEDLGKKEHWNRAFPPSTAHLRKIAVDLVRPFGEESTRLWMTLRGKPSAIIDPAERVRTGEKLSAFAAELKQKSDCGADDDLREIADRSSDRRDDHRTRSILAEYEHSGLEPMRNRDGTLVSLSMLTSLGWTIKVDDGHATLMKPTAAPEPVGRGLYGEQSKPEIPTSARGIGELAKDIVR